MFIQGGNGSEAPTFIFLSIKLMGRRKIRIKPIKEDRNRYVTFMKRKAGLFKKAHELAVLCQVELALIITTPESKTYEYFTGNLEEILARRLELPIEESKCPADFGIEGDDSDSASNTSQNISKPDSLSKDVVNDIHKDQELSDRSPSKSDRPKLKVQIPPMSLAMSQQLIGNVGHQGPPGQVGNDVSVGSNGSHVQGGAPGMDPSKVGRSDDKKISREPSPHTGLHSTQGQTRGVPGQLAQPGVGGPQNPYYNEVRSPAQYQYNTPVASNYNRQQQGYFPGYTPIATQGYFGAPFPVNYALPGYNQFPNARQNYRWSAGQPNQPGVPGQPGQPTPTGQNSSAQGGIPGSNNSHNPSGMQGTSLVPGSQDPQGPSGMHGPHGPPGPQGPPMPQNSQGPPSANSSSLNLNSQNSGSIPINLNQANHGATPVGHEPGMISATAASMPSRYINDTLMSPSNYFSMEWGVWDPNSAKPMETPTEPTAHPVSGAHEGEASEEGLKRPMEYQEGHPKWKKES